MKRKNTVLTTLAQHWYDAKRGISHFMMKLLAILWIVGMSGLALFVLMLWLSLE